MQDEDTEDGEPGQYVPHIIPVSFRILCEVASSLLLIHTCRKYTTTLKSLIPLPDPESSPTSASHPNAYDEYQTGTTVLGLYPDTSCFYTAVVAGGPRDHFQGGQRVSGLSEDLFSFTTHDIALS